MKCYFCNEDINAIDIPDHHHPDKVNKPNEVNLCHHKCHMIHHNLYPKNYNEFRQLVDAKKQYQQTRIRLLLQINSLKRLGLQPSERDKEIFELMKKKENDLTKEYTKIVKELTLWKEWGKNVSGIGMNTFGQLISYIMDIKRFDRISKLNSFSGLGLYDGKIQCLKKGYKHNYHPEIRSLLFTITEGFIKHKKTSYYGKLYDTFKQQLQQQHPQPIANNNDSGFKQNYTKMHIHLMAMRKVEKEFIKHLWIIWRTLEGLPVTEPYEVKVLGHNPHEIPYFDFSKYNKNS